VPLSPRRKVFEALARRLFDNLILKVSATPVVSLGRPFSSAWMAQLDETAENRTVCLAWVCFFKSPSAAVLAQSVQMRIRRWVRFFKTAHRLNLASLRNFACHPNSSRKKRLLGPLCRRSMQPQNFRAGICLWPSYVFSAAQRSATAGKLGKSVNGSVWYQ
jgi:hypothetical protein